MKKMNKKQTLSVLDNLGIKPSKKLGQNFLIDENIGRKILNEANISESDVILEIGPGLGALLREIIKIAKKVYAYEIDSRLYNYLKSQLTSYDNLLLYNDDFLSIEQPDVDKVVSNIPYTITGPIFEKVFYVNNPPEGILTIEKSIADRIFHPNKYKNISRISITCNAFMVPISLHDISSSVFYPEPRIKLSLIHVKPKKKIDPFLINQETKQFFLELIRGIMPYKNKNLVNALNLYLKNNYNIQISKQELLQMLEDNCIKNDKFALSDIDYFIHLSKTLSEFIKNLKQCD
jgi:16S rRNA (adenine1518-N6/adenine1519-N6)-dimethyltransferase